MEVSEPVLFNTLAQEQNKKQKLVRKIENKPEEKETLIQKNHDKDLVSNPLLYLEKQIIGQDRSSPIFLFTIIKDLFEFRRKGMRDTCPRKLKET